MSRDQAPPLPATLEVGFVPYACGTATWEGIPGDWSAGAELSAAGLATDAEGIEATWGVRDSAHAVFLANPAGDDGADPSNASALTALADQIAADFWGWRLVAYDRVYNGVVVPATEGLTDSIEWTMRRGDCSTRMRTGPLDDEPETLNHSDPAHDCPNCVEVYGPTVVHSSNLVEIPRFRLCKEGENLVVKPGGVDAFQGCCGLPPISCGDCSIPDGPLTFTWYYSISSFDRGPYTPPLGGPIETTLTPTTSGGVTTWDSGVFPCPSDSTSAENLKLAGEGCYMQFLAGCPLGNGTGFHVRYGSNADGSGFFDDTLSITLDSCDPLMIEVSSGSTFTFRQGVLTQ